MEFSNPAFRQPPVDAYGDGGFRVDGKRVEGSILLLPARMQPWPVQDLSVSGPDVFRPLIAMKSDFDVLLIGCGRQMAFLPKVIREHLSGHGISFDVMITPAACRTYNILASEDRPVAGAFIAVD
ncbi:conserved protein [Tepidicaulis marinus]|uniref:Conserved protein n=1 Tax=Tepidicaulis marinus TaxID=1333998 RepID=A0A081B7G5_9HYPH|nr:Mth938-like domain-containing protein [Tepidicaulis marinus]GAK43983.1 conserved protein [Tepidicaulis marinus]